MATKEKTDLIAVDVADVMRHLLAQKTGAGLRARMSERRQAFRECVQEDERLLELALDEVRRRPELRDKMAGTVFDDAYRREVQRRKNAQKRHAPSRRPRP